MNPEVCEWTGEDGDEPQCSAWAIHGVWLPHEGDLTGATLLGHFCEKHSLAIVRGMKPGLVHWHEIDSLCLGQVAGATPGASKPENEGEVPRKPREGTEGIRFTRYKSLTPPTS